MWLKVNLTMQLEMRWAQNHNWASKKMTFVIWSSPRPMVAHLRTTETKKPLHPSDEEAYRLTLVQGSTLHRVLRPFL